MKVGQAAYANSGAPPPPGGEAPPPPSGAGATKPNDVNDVDGQ